MFPTDERDDNAYNGGEQMAEMPLLDNFYIREFNFLMISWNISVCMYVYPLSYLFRNKCI